MITTRSTYTLFLPNLYLRKHYTMILSIAIAYPVSCYRRIGCNFLILLSSERRILQPHLNTAGVSLYIQHIICQWSPPGHLLSGKPWPPQKWGLPYYSLQKTYHPEMLVIEYRLNIGVSFMCLPWKRPPHCNLFPHSHSLHPLSASVSIKYVNCQNQWTHLLMIPRKWV